MGRLPLKSYLLDTHVWIWHLQGNESLSQPARKLVDDHLEVCHLSPISVWEAGILRERGKIRIQGDFRNWVEESRQKLPLKTALLSDEIALTTFELDLAHRDPADRFLAATALVYELVLVTADRRLLDSEMLETFSAR